MSRAEGGTLPRRETVSWLQAARAAHREEVGGKAANLGELISAGFEVPPGFVVTTTSYRRAVDAAGLAARIRSALADGDEAAEATIRDAFAGLTLPADVERDLLAAYDALGGGPVAVRSSATAEDLAEASFAGQQDTYLGIDGPEELLRAVIHCWASLWTARAISYRRRNGLDEGDVAMAVVVQRMIPADASGVMFTVDPVDGSGDTTVIEAAWGLGESIVSGSVTPDSYRVRRRRAGAAVTRRLGTKETRIDMVPGGGSARRPVEPRDRRRFALGRGQAIELARIGDRVERFYGAPQDIEWALWDGRLYLTQSRPVSARAAEAAPRRERAGRFATALQRDAIEHYPGPFPLDIAAVRVAHAALLSVAAKHGISTVPVEEMITLDGDGVARVAPPALGLTDGLLGLWRRNRHRNAPDPATWDTGPGAEFAARTVALSRTEEQLRAMSDEEVARHLRLSLELAGEVLEVRFRDYVFEQVFRGMAVDFWLTLARTRLTQYDLLGELDYVTAAVDRGLHALGRSAVELGVDTVLRGAEPEDAWQELAQTAEGRVFLDRVDAFLQRFGARTVRMYLPFSNRSWGEEPAALLAMIATVLSAPDAGGTDERGAHDRRMAETARRLPPPLRRRFERSVAVYRAGHLAREASVYAVEKVYVVARQGTDEAARRFVERGALAEAEDVRYLTLGEVEETLAAPAAHDRRELVARRSARRPAAEAEWWAPATTTSSGSVLKGAAGSPGIVRGQVRVVLGPADFGRLRPGDVLVCTFTDPAWTPLFAVASAVVADTGGKLSHAAIVAREYGIPAVLGCGDATRRLADGDRVEVDGGRGTVTAIAGDG